VQGRDKTLYFTVEGITYSLAGGDKGNPQRWTVKLDFGGADPGVGPVREAPTGGVVSYFRGKPSEWKTGIPTGA
jgi:hypothetical protein